MKRSSVMLLLLLAVAAGALAQDARLDASFQALSAYEVGQDPAPLDHIEAEVMASATNETARQTLANRLAGLLSANVTFEAKKFACRMLAACGNATQVPALAALLPNETGSGLARLALEKIPGPEAGAALVDALGRTKGLLRAGVVNSLGARRDPANVPVLAGLLGDSDELVAEAAAVGLGETGGAAAEAAIAKALPGKAGKTRAALVDSWLKCAAQSLAEGKKEAALGIYQALAVAGEAPQVRAAAFQGGILARGGDNTQVIVEALASQEQAMRQAALGLVAAPAAGAATGALINALGGLEPDTQAALLLALAARGDKSATEAVTQAVGSPEAKVRLAAIQALGILGDGRAVVVLAQRAAATEGEERRVSRESLYRVSGAGVDDAFLGSVKSAEPKVRAELIRALAERKTAAALPLLLKEARSADKDVASEAFRALGILAAPKDMKAVVRLLVKARSDESRDAARRAVVAAAKRIERKEGKVKEVLKAYGRAHKTGVKVALLEVLGEVGSRDGLDTLREAIAKKDEDLQDAAIKALAGWPSPNVIPDLLALAESARKPGQRDTALDGAIRLQRAAENPPAEQALAFYAKAAALAGSASTKRHVLAGLGELKDLKALEIARACAKDPAVAEEAAIAADKIRSHFFSATASAAADRVRQAFDSNMESRWDTAGDQTPGQWFQVDLGGEMSVAGIRLDCSPSRNDFPRGYQVFVFSDPENPGAPVATGAGDKPVTEITFAPKTGRFVKIVQTGAAPGAFWSIHELRVISK